MMTRAMQITLVIILVLFALRNEASEIQLVTSGVAFCDTNDNCNTHGLGLSTHLRINGSSYFTVGFLGSANEKITYSGFGLRIFNSKTFGAAVEALSVSRRKTEEKIISPVIYVGGTKLSLFVNNSDGAKIRILRHWSF